MNATLAGEVAKLSDMGWHVRSQTDTTASLETRGPFSWLLFALSILLFFGLGGLLYIAFWLLTSRAHLFLRVQDGGVASSGDTWLVAEQQADEQRARRLAIDIKRRGFWAVMWPSIVAMLLMIVVWFVVIRLAVAATS